MGSTTSSQPHCHGRDTLRSEASIRADRHGKCALANEARIGTQCYKSRVQYEIGHVGIFADDVATDVDVRNRGERPPSRRYSGQQRAVANEEGSDDIAENINLTTGCDISSHEEHVTYVSRGCKDVCHVGVCTYYVATDIKRLNTGSNDAGQLGAITNEEGCYNVAEDIDLSARSNVATHEEHVTYVSRGRQDVCHIGVRADDIATDVKVCRCWECEACDSGQLGAITYEERCDNVAEDIDLSARSNVATHEEHVTYVSRGCQDIYG